ncbi:MAG: BREX protein BrxB domain-containing protein [Candidatus Paceibacterota bacterium]
MPSNNQIERQLASLSRTLRNGLSKMKSEAHGGNSILVVYPPEKEGIFIDTIKEAYNNDEHKFINIASLLTTQVEELGGAESLVGEIELVGEIPKRFFKDPFVNRVRKEIKEAVENGKKPILYRIGALVGIVSLNRILEDSEVLSLEEQIVVLYPGIYREGGSHLFFLDERRESSSYRAKIITSKS